MGRHQSKWIRSALWVLLGFNELVLGGNQSQPTRAHWEMVEQAKTCLSVQSTSLSLVNAIEQIREVVRGQSDLMATRWESFVGCAKAKGLKIQSPPDVILVSQCLEPYEAWLSVSPKVQMNQQDLKEAEDSLRALKSHYRRCLQASQSSNKS